jgi:hypothetical protein
VMPGSVIGLREEKSISPMGARWKQYLGRTGFSAKKVAEQNPAFRALVLQRKLGALFARNPRVVYPTLPAFLHGGEKSRIEKELLLTRT